MMLGSGIKGSADLDPNPHQRYDDIHLVDYDGSGIKGGMWIRIRIQKTKRNPEKGKKCGA
jgi:hypothetical protein